MLYYRVQRSVFTLW